MDEQQRQSILDLPKVVAGAIASPAAAILTSRFGAAGTLLGLALSAVIVTVVSDILKFYLARAPGTVTRIPGGFRKKPPLQRLLVRLSLPFSKLSSLPPVRRRSILVGSFMAGGIVFIVGLVVVTALELSAGKDLSCWVWNNCPTESSTDSGGASNISTRPSILGGGQSAVNNAPQVETTPSQQQQPTPPSEAPGTPSQPQNIPGSETPDPSLQPSQRQSPSDAPEDQQQVPSTDVPEDRQPKLTDSNVEGQQPETPPPPASQDGGNQ